MREDRVEHDRLLAYCRAHEDELCMRHGVEGTPPCRIVNQNQWVGKVIAEGNTWGECHEKLKGIYEVQD